MGRDGMILGAAGRSHATNQTPTSVSTSWCADGAWSFRDHPQRHGPLDVINWMGTTATFGFMLAYLLVAIAAPLYLYRGVSRTSPLSWWGSSAR